MLLSQMRRKRSGKNEEPNYQLKEEIVVQRCIKPADLGKVVESCIHHFSFQLHPKTDTDMSTT